MGGGISGMPCPETSHPATWGFPDRGPDGPRIHWAVEKAVPESTSPRFDKHAGATMRLIQKDPGQMPSRDLIAGAASSDTGQCAGHGQSMLTGMGG
jgi:hypothetical protein